MFNFSLIQTLIITITSPVNFLKKRRATLSSSLNLKRLRASSLMNLVKWRSNLIMRQSSKIVLKKRIIRDRLSSEGKKEEL